MTTFTQIATRKVGQIHVVTFNPRRVMDPIVIEEIGAELESLINENQGSTFLLDLDNVEFLSSAVLNRLIVLDKNVKSGQGILAFCGLRPAVSEVFAITKLDLLFKIYGSCDEALDQLQ